MYIIKVEIDKKVMYLQGLGTENLPCDNCESFTANPDGAMKFEDWSEAEGVREELKSAIEPSEIVELESSNEQ